MRRAPGPAIAYRIVDAYPLCGGAVRKQLADTPMIAGYLGGSCSLAGASTMMYGKREMDLKLATRPKKPAVADITVYMSAPKAMLEIERTVSELGAKVAKARAERGWSLAQLAERAGLS